MSLESTAKKPVIYLPGLPSLSSDDIDLYERIHDARKDLIRKLAAAALHIEDIDGANAWLRNMLPQAERSDAFFFPPMTSLATSHPRFQAEAAKRWFEFFSVVTGVHIGNPEKYTPNGLAKPCIVMDPDGQWSLAIDLLIDLHEKGMFTSRVADIVQLALPEQREDYLRNYAAINAGAVQLLHETIAAQKGKQKKDVHTLYPPDYIFHSSRKAIARHPFGVAFFGSASTREASYLDASATLAKLVGERGWRMITGAGKDGCMGAADHGLNEGKKLFRQRFPKAKFKPAHIGVSTQDILRLEGPPKYLDQLIITGDIYERMQVMIRGQKSEDPTLRVRDAVRVAFVAPGGTGTLHEFATMMQLATNGSMMAGRKIILLNFPNHLRPDEGFWAPLIATAHILGFNKNFEIAHSPEEAITLADAAYQDWLLTHPEYTGLPHPIFNPHPE